MSSVAISVSKVSSGLAVSPTVAETTAGAVVTWTLDASVLGSFNSAQPFDWYTDCGPPAGTCSAPTISPDGRSLTISFLTSTDLNLAYKLFVRLSNGKIATTTYGPIGSVPVGGGNTRLPPSSPKIKNL